MPAVFEPAVCLTSSLSPLNNSSRRVHRQSSVEGEDAHRRTNDAGDVGDKHRDNSARPHHRHSWVQGNCTEATRQRLWGAVFCAYTHPLFNRGRGLSVITTAKRLEQITSRSVFGEGKGEDEADEEDEEAGADSKTARASLDWPPLPDGDAGHAAGASSRLFPPAYRAEAIPGKDMGLVATRAIRRGERIMARTPALMIDSDAIDGLRPAAFDALVHAAAAGLPDAHRAQYFNLSGNHGTSHDSSGSSSSDVVNDAAYQVFATNAFRTSLNDGATDLHSVFVEGTFLLSSP